ncbi:uncharacterized protein isoform X2 [Rhodnius prolixus]|uniref:uncharacterized protein isoform X2 n=1 Tax=Rhodnius prolixus TaxID=13249 RepID=UPI003D187F84
MENYEINSDCGEGEDEEEFDSSVDDSEEEEAEEDNLDSSLEGDGSEDESDHADGSDNIDEKIEQQLVNSKSRFSSVSIDLSHTPTSLRCSPKDNIACVATINGDLTFVKFDQTGIECIAQVECYKEESCVDIDFSKSGDTLYTICGQYEVVMVDVNSRQMHNFGNLCNDDENSNLTNIKCINHWYFCTGDNKGQVKIWDSRHIKPFKETGFLRRSSDEVNDYLSDMIVNKDGNRIATASGAGVVTVFDTRKLNIINQNGESKSDLTSLASVSNDRELVAGSLRGDLVFTSWQAHATGWIFLEAILRPVAFLKDASLLSISLFIQQHRMFRRLTSVVIDIFTTSRCVQRKKHEIMVVLAARLNRCLEIMPIAYTLPYLQSDLEIKFKKNKIGILYDCIAEWERETPKQPVDEPPEDELLSRKKKKKKKKKKIVAIPANFKFSKAYHFKHGVPSYKKYTLDDFIWRIKEAKKYESLLFLPKFKILQIEIVAICLEAIKIFMSQRIIIELNCPVTIVGDIRGHFYDLVRYIDFGGFPPRTSYLFLGNYISENEFSIETLTLILMLKVKFPENIFLLRGNRECDRYAEYSGFKNECLKRYKKIVWKSFLNCFNCMPVAAIVCTIIFCCHGGLGPKLDHIRDIRALIRPTAVPEKGIYCDLLSADPLSKLKKSYFRNLRQFSVYFTEPLVDRFLMKHMYQMIVRSNQFIKKGYKFQMCKRVLTVFSVPFIPIAYNNLGVVVSVRRPRSSKIRLTFFALKLNTLECQLNRFFHIGPQHVLIKRQMMKRKIKKTKKLYQQLNKTRSKLGKLLRYPRLNQFYGRSKKTTLTNN